MVAGWLIVCTRCEAWRWLCLAKVWMIGTQVVVDPTLSWLVDGVRGYEEEFRMLDFALDHCVDGVVLEEYLLHALVSCNRAHNRRRDNSRWCRRF